MTSPEPVLKPKPDAGYDTPPVEKRRCSGKGGFVSSAPSLDTQRLSAGSPCRVVPTNFILAASTDLFASGTATLAR